ncbi:hypothetical protein BC6307_04785 [Sutcliffiella cohnii]|uniref:Nucleotide-diphospho-sugar transferase domain-containing protein n=1 Tax=Sutcliffiella cohnii TaxID=33932 RepID=A0A223KMR2_9BACI|nr:hypothetical protein [Sutcliffiella cohnii]AST90644.1 hypothetical protein BC6307_04785 [Sutcliffiella cohnii]
MLFGTISCSDHLHLAINMAKSAKKHHPNSRIVLCLVEKSIHPILWSQNIFDKIVLVEELNIPEWNNLIKKYNRYETAISVRGHFFEYLLNTFPNEKKYIYLDPDTKVYSPFTEVDSILDNFNLVLTPHILTPAPKNKISEFELLLFHYGVYNLGFFAFTNSEESFEYIEFLKVRLTNYCYVDMKKGLYADQKWIDAVPCFFNTYILKHPGYNVAIWNFPERLFSMNNNGQILVNEEPLRFIHFSGLIKDGLAEYFNRFGSSKPIIVALQNEYLTEIENLGKVDVEKIPWSFK